MCMKSLKVVSLCYSEGEALCSITSSVFRKVIVLCKGDEKAQSFAWGVGLCGRKHPGR